MIQFSHILDKFGGIGPSQLILFFLVSYYNISKGANSISTVFIAYIPNKRCNVPPLDNPTAYPNLTEQDILNYTTSYDDGTQQYDTCVRYGYNLSTCTGDLSCVNQSYPSIACDKGYHYDDSLFTKTIITEFNLVCDRKYLNALSTSFYYIGMLVGSFLFGSTADRHTWCIHTPHVQHQVIMHIFPQVWT
uniref:solute carrier family 22 member 4-like isoform X2 n=1 Tax=Ciona intestinalis TaxID=7719 RepID=UPI000EF51BD2|nr:solute carrier family 22 member 4-like isoform X2 [Ciona intestinalis]|eukprot:XP_026693097.1 solute carrier family 22 member 4-like isoform X2 [Ciona intestinalis]